LEDVPQPFGFTIDRDVRMAVAVVIGHNRYVTRKAPRISRDGESVAVEDVEVRLARIRRRTEDRRVRLAVVVVIGRNEDVSSDSPVQCREAVRRLVDVPVAFAAAEDRYVSPSVAVKVSSSIAYRRDRAAYVIVGFEG